jgi:membrane-associated phospholipid phosphatase
MLNPIIEFDRTLSLWVHSAARPWLDVTMRVITHAGDSLTLFVVAVACATFLMLRQQRKRAAAILLFVYSCSYLLDYALKHFFQRTRPQLWEILVARPSSYSFPSGHAMSSMAVYGLAALLLARLYPQQRWAFQLSAASLISLIGFSRVYLGVHWPSDVLGGFLLGSALMFTGISLTQHSDRHNAG